MSSILCCFEKSSALEVPLINPQAFISETNHDQATLEDWDNFNLEADQNINPSLLFLLYDLKKQGRALDLGSGIGSNTQQLLDRGWMVTAVDISQKAIDVLKLNKSEKLEVVHSSLEDFHPTKQYDLILAINVLAFCPADRIQEIWDKMYQSLNKHGFLLCTLPVPIGREFARWYVSKNDMSQLFIQNRYKVIRSTHLTDKNTVHPLALTLQKV